MIMARDEKTMEGMQIALDTTKIDNGSDHSQSTSYQSKYRLLIYISRVCQRHLHDDLCSVKSRLSIM